MSSSATAETTVDPNPTGPTTNTANSRRIVPNYEGPSRLQRDLAAAKELQERVKNLQVTPIVRKDLTPATPEATPAPVEKSPPTKDAPPPTKDAQPPTNATDKAMDVDELEVITHTSSEATQKRPSTPEIKELSEDDQIKLRAKEHVSIWK